MALQAIKTKKVTTIDVPEEKDLRAIKSVTLKKSTIERLKVYSRSIDSNDSRIIQEILDDFLTKKGF
ncbi:hypothetical protein V757_02785 [Pelistega indica]|uniref:Uncharacterized protein n=1 Tax=Pelistega indica TaxID=1414851 RepID=V8GAG4_9BURK|nr:hypothetical protein [Pelistega indica]ETD72682.1 hypothetical protein V757_02785 [Pelistega indica]